MSRIETPDGVLECIPKSADVRRELACALERVAVLRRLLRIAEKVERKEVTKPGNPKATAPSGV